MDFIIDKKLFTANIKINFTHIHIKLNSRTLLCKSSKPVQNGVLKNSVETLGHGFLNR